MPLLFQREGARKAWVYSKGGNVAIESAVVSRITVLKADIFRRVWFEGWGLAM